MSQRILYVTLNTGQMAVQRPAAIHPKALQVLRPRVARLLSRKPGESRTWLGVSDPFFPFELNSQENVYGPLFLVVGEEKRRPSAGYQQPGRRGPLADDPPARPPRVAPAAGDTPVLPTPRAVVHHRASHNQAAARRHHGRPARRPGAGGDVGRDGVSERQDGWASGHPCVAKDPRAGVGC